MLSKIDSLFVEPDYYLQKSLNLIGIDSRKGQCTNLLGPLL